MTLKKLFIGTVALALGGASLFYISSKATIEAATTQAQYDSRVCQTIRAAKDRGDDIPSWHYCLQNPQAASTPTAGNNTPKELTYIGLNQFPFGGPTQTGPGELDTLTELKGLNLSNYWKQNFTPVGAFPGVGAFRMTNWNKHLVSKGIVFKSTSAHITAASARANIDQTYLISNGFTTSSGALTNWRMINILYSAPTANSLKLYYRVADEPTSDPNDEDWIPIAITKFGSGRPFQLNQVNQAGTYFQFKVHIGSNTTRVEAFNILAELAQEVVPSPSPTPSVAVSPTVSASPGTGSAASPTPAVSPTPDLTKGRITIVTKQIIPSSIASPSPSPSGPALPESSASPSVPSEVDPNCFDRHDTEPAPSVRLSVRQTTGGTAKAEDQSTDEDGIWHGLQGKVDEFPVGTYTVSLGDFRSNEYKLVALCITPDDGQHYLKTQTSASGKKATIIVAPNQETKVTALYAPRAKPYITMSKFAVEGDIKTVSDTKKVLRRIYPGQSFLYLVTYENTGDADATDVVIRDVLPDQISVPEDLLDEVEDKYGFTVSLDSKLRKVVTKPVGELKKGQRGSFLIPVMLSQDPFDTEFDQAFNFSLGTGTSLK